MSCRLVFAVSFWSRHLSPDHEPLMHPISIVIFLERIQFSFKVPCVPKRRLVEILSPDGPDQAFHEWV